MKKLYPHQEEAVEQVRQAFMKGSKRVCLQAPTGMGKTVVATHVIKSALAKGKKVLFLVHLKELIEQTATTMMEAGLQYGYISASYPFTKGKQLYLASTQTLSRRLGKIPFQPDFIVYDEFHHAPAKTSRIILDHYRDCYLLGLTATPQRLDGKGLIDVADTLVTTITTGQLIERGFLSKYEYYGPMSGIDFDNVHTMAGDYNPKEMEEELDKTQIFGKVVEHYKKFVFGKPALCFCLNIKHSIKIANEFKMAGIPSAHLDGTTPRLERERINNEFKSGKIWVLVNVALVTEGYDVPACKAIFLTRPTQSLTIFLQSVGRGLRKSGDDVCYIFDHVENYKRHGMPDDEREWSLLGEEKSAKTTKKKSKDYIACSNCGFTYLPKKYKICPKCSNQEMGTKETQHTNHELQKITGYKKEEVRKNTFTKEQIKEMKRKCRTIDDYKNLARTLNYKEGWARMQMGLRDKWKKRFAQ